MVGSAPLWPLLDVPPPVRCRRTVSRLGHGEYLSSALSLQGKPRFGIYSSLGDV